MGFARKIWGMIPEEMKRQIKDLKRKQAVRFKNAEIHPTSTISLKSRIGNNTKIGRYTNINERSYIGTCEIGSFCAIAPEVMVIAGNHKTSKPGMQAQFYHNLLNANVGHQDKGGIKIGNDVWIGSRATILPGVDVGDGAIIGAGSIVTKDVEPYEVVGGNPASHIKYRFPEHIREQLLEIEWWTWPVEKIKRNKDFFTTNLRDLDEDFNLEELID